MIPRPAADLVKTTLPWMPRLPRHWRLLALARVTDARCDGPFGSAIKSEHYVDEGVRVVRLQNIGSARYRDGDSAFLDPHYVQREIGDGHWVVPGDILMAGLGDENNPLGRACVAPESLGPTIVKADCYRFRLDQARVDARFAALQLSALAYAECGFLATGSTRQRLNLGLASARYLSLPDSLEEQRRIVRWLDRETARIDALIEKKTRFIELLREKRQALITQAVTRGLDSAVPMKDSGIDWIGSVPSHWAVSKIKRLVASISQGWSPECESRPAEPEEWAVLKVGCVNGGVFRPQENKALPAELEPRPDLGLRRGDVLISRANTRELVGSCAVVTDDHPRLMLCDKLYRLRAAAGADPTYLAYLIAVHGRRQVEIEATGTSASMVNIAQDVILDLPVPVPPMAEQVALVELMRRATQKLKQIDQATTYSIELLRERRAALITAAVTGQIDLREAA